MRTFSASRPQENPRRPSIMVHGLTGSGKTTRALVGGKPLVICTEPKAEAHVLNLNPSATCWVPESCEDLEQIFVWLGKPELRDKEFTRIVLDSYTELTEMLPNWIIRKANPEIHLEIGRKMELQEYKPVQQWGIALVRAIQLTSLPSIIIARSDAKEIGRVRKIVPAGLGSSVQGLPAQLVPTVEAHWDEELQTWIWDSRPDAYSQRCGLSWLPMVWDGSADDFLALVGKPSPAHAPVIPEKTTAERIAEARAANQVTEDAIKIRQEMAEPDPKWVAAIATLAQVTLNAAMTADKRNEIVQAWEDKGSSALPDLLKAIEAIKANTKTETVHEAFSAQQSEALAVGRLAPISQATKDFVDGVDPLPKAMSDGQWVACQQMCDDKDIDINALEAYAIEKNYLAQTGPACRRKLGWMTGDYYIKLAAIAGDPIKRRALVAHLKSMEAVK